MGQKYILDLDYSALIKKYLKTELASEILDNLTYVQIYKDQIKGMPIKHQQISYR